MKTAGHASRGIVLAGLSLMLIAGCSKSSSDTFVAPTTTLSGVLVKGGNAPVPGVTVNILSVISQDDLLAALLALPVVIDDNDPGGPAVWHGAYVNNVPKGIPLPDPVLLATTTTNGVGRWSFDGLDFGLYDVAIDLAGTGITDLAPLHFNNRPVLDPDILAELQQANLLDEGTFGDFMPIFLPPLVGSVDIFSNIGTPQTLVYDDGKGNNPLQGLSLFVPANLQVVKDGAPLADGASTTLQLSLVAPEQVPMPLMDENGDGRTNQLFFSLQPVGVEFVVPGTYDVMAGFGTEMLVQLTYPNVNGLAPGSTVELFRFDHENHVDPIESFQWVSAGTGTVSGDGLLVEPDAGAGLPEAGWHGPPGPPPPTIKVQGNLLSNGVPFPQANITIVTNNGLTGFTDATGFYCIENVPIIGGDTQIISRAFTNLSLTYEVATSAPQPVVFPATTADIDFELQGSPLDEEPPTVESTIPDHGVANLPTDAPIEVLFDELIDEFTLMGGIVVTPTQFSAKGGAPTPVSGTIVPQTVNGNQTNALFIPDGLLEPGTMYDVTVGPLVADLNGNQMVGAYVFAFTTDLDPANEPLAFSMNPQSGPAGTSVEILGVNLDSAIAIFDDIFLELDPGGSPNSLVFEVPALNGVTAGVKEVDVFSFGVDPGKGSIIATFSFALQPRITEVSPASGELGTTLFITGNNFDDFGINESVTFNSVPAFVGEPFIGLGIEPDAENVVVQVPDGASSGALVVTVTEGFSTAPVFFSVTAPVDMTAPLLDSSTPVAGAVNVLQGSTIVLVFDELISADSTVSVSATVQAGIGAQVLEGSHAVTADAQGRGVLTFTPTDPMPFSSLIAVIDDTIIDLAGNSTGLVVVSFTIEDDTNDPDIKCQQMLDAYEAGNLQVAKGLAEELADNETASDQLVNKAELTLAFIEYTLFFDQEGTSVASLAFQTLLEDFGFPAGGPDLFNLDLFSAPLVLPADSPNCGELQAFAANFAIPAMVDLMTALELLPASIDVPLACDGGSTVFVDHTDILGMTTWFKKCLADMHVMLAYGCPIDIDQVILDKPEPIDFWNANPTLGTLQSMSDLISAQQYLRDFVTCYGLTVDSLLAETDDQLDDLITFGMGEDVAQNMADAETLRDNLNDLSAATQGPVMIDFPNAGMFSFDFSTPFSTLSPRDLVPVLMSRSNFPALAIGPGHPLLDLNSMISPGLTADQVNDILGLRNTNPDVLATIDLEDGSVADWPPGSMLFADPTGDEELEGDINGFANKACDIAGVHVAHDANNYYFRIDFDGGTPGALSEHMYTYNFIFDSNNSNMNQPDLDGQIQGSFGADPFFALSDANSGAQIDLGTPDPPFVQFGDGFLEFRLPTSVLGNPPVDIPDGAEYVFEFESNVTDLGIFEDGFDSGGTSWSSSLDLP
jgi:hypothetical protein